MSELPMVCIVRVAKKGYAEMYEFSRLIAILIATAAGVAVGIAAFGLYVFPFMSPILSPSMYAIAGIIASFISLTSPLVWGVIIIALIVTSPVLYALWKCLR